VSTPPEARPPITEPGAIRCPRCDAPIHGEQDWCLQCGAPARTRLAPTPNWRAPVALVVLLLVLSGVALAIAFVTLTGGDGDVPVAQPAAAPATANPALPPTTPTTPAPTAAAPSTATSTATTVATTPATTPKTSTAAKPKMKTAAKSKSKSKSSSTTTTTTTTTGR
jgi:hypothetical protein